MRIVHNAPVRYIESNGQGHVKSSSLDIPILRGIFEADDPHEPILQLLLDLQAYHQKHNFSHQERFSEPDAWSEKILANLAETITRARQMIDDARHNNTPITIESSIKIETPQFFNSPQKAPPQSIFAPN